MTEKGALMTSEVCLWLARGLCCWRTHTGTRSEQNRLCVCPSSACLGTSLTPRNGSPQQKKLKSVAVPACNITLHLFLLLAKLVLYEVQWNSLELGFVCNLTGFAKYMELYICRISVCAFNNLWGMNKTGVILCTKSFVGLLCVIKEMWILLLMQGSWSEFASWM